MLLMTVGMSLTSLVYHDVYPSLTMVESAHPFEIAMTLFLAIVVARFYQAKSYSVRYTPGHWVGCLRST